MANKANQKISTYTLATVGLMAALVFVSSGMRIMIPIGTSDNAALHLGNVFCLLSGLLLGKKRGGMAAGLGSMIYDLTNPLYIASAPFTFIFKFLMAYLCGLVAYSGGKKARNTVLNAAAGIIGQLTYVALYLSKGFVEQLINGATWQAAGLVQITKLPTTLINAVIAVVVSVMLAPIFSVAMKKSGIYAKLFPAT